MSGRATILVGSLCGILLGLAIVALVFGLTRDDGEGGGQQAAAGAFEPAPLPPVSDAGEEVTESDLRPVALFFAGGVRRLLQAEARNIFWTTSATERARQVVVELVRGPLPDGRLGPVIPEGFSLREVYVLPDGTAWVDLATPGRPPSLGSRGEWAAVESIALSLTANFEEIRRVGLLLDGEQAESLAGHLDLGRTYTGREWFAGRFRIEQLLPEGVGQSVEPEQEIEADAEEDAAPEAPVDEGAEAAAHRNPETGPASAGDAAAAA